MTLSALKDFAMISFFKGALLLDPHKILDKPGPNSQAARYLKFTHIEDIVKQEASIRLFIQEAIALEKAGRKVEFKKNPQPISTELFEKFEEDLMLKHAFEALSPGRQRAYILYFSQPKQFKTRISRIEKCIGKILNVEGLHDKYNSTKR